jgi:hypothetical protein
MAPQPVTNGPSQTLTCAITPAAPPPGTTTNSVKSGNLDCDISAVEAAITQAKLAGEHYQVIFNQKHDFFYNECVVRGNLTWCDPSSADPDLKNVYEKEVNPAHSGLDNSVLRLRRDFKKELLRRLPPNLKGNDLIAQAIIKAKDIIHDNRVINRLDLKFKELPQDNMLTKIASDVIDELQAEMTGRKPEEVSHLDLFSTVFAVQVRRVPQEIL